MNTRKLLVKQFSFLLVFILVGVFPLSAFSEVPGGVDPLSFAGVFRTVVSLLFVLGLAVFSISFLKKRLPASRLRPEHADRRMFVKERVRIDRKNEIVTVQYNEEQELILGVNENGVKLLGVINERGRFATAINENIVEESFPDPLFIDEWEEPFEDLTSDKDDDQESH